MDPNSPFAQNAVARDAEPGSAQTATAANDPQHRSDGAASRSRARRSPTPISRASSASSRARPTAPTSTIYTIDPRGLVGRWATSTSRSIRSSGASYVRKSQDSLRVLAEETGGIAVVNQNDFSKALKRIDAETSDYYVLGYYSKNPDILKRRRQVEVKVTRTGLHGLVRARNTC